MTHDELLTKINSLSCCSGTHELALRAVVELHPKTMDGYCAWCYMCNRERTGLYMDEELYRYPCPTIQAIESALQ